ncbi:hypothetical protein [Sphingomonas daechungensis]|nr:hypothetical protein [Sphingomonas daechungensis]
MPWAGLVVGIIAVAAVHQFGSDGTFDKCATIAPGPLLIAGALGLVACSISGLASWRSLRLSKDHPRQVVATISVGCAALFALAILYPMIASLILPPCFG